MATLGEAELSEVPNLRVGQWWGWGRDGGPLCMGVNPNLQTLREECVVLIFCVERVRISAEGEAQFLARRKKLRARLHLPAAFLTLVGRYPMIARSQN